MGLLTEIEISAANLYLRLAERAKTEGDLVLYRRLAETAKQEAAQAIALGAKLNGCEGKRRWHWYQMGSKWRRGANLRARNAAILEYLGATDVAGRPWSEILPLLGSAEFLIAILYLVRSDFRTAWEEFGHAKANGVSLRHIARGIYLCFQLLIQGLKAI